MIINIYTLYILYTILYTIPYYDVWMRYLQGAFLVLTQYEWQSLRRRLARCTELGRWSINGARPGLAVNRVKDSRGTSSRVDLLYSTVNLHWIVGSFCSGQIGTKRRQFEREQPAICDIHWIHGRIFSLSLPTITLSWNWADLQNDAVGAIEMWPPFCRKS